MSPLLLPVFRRHKWLCALLAAVLLAQAILLVALPLPLRTALDHITSGDRNLQTLLMFSGLALLLGLLSTAFEYLEEQFNARLVSHMVTDLRHDLLNKIFSRRLSWHEERHKVDLLGRVIGDVQNLEIYVTTTPVILLRAIPSICLALGAMFWLDIRFSLTLIVLLGGLYALSSTFARKVRAAEKKYRSQNALIERDLHQSFAAVNLIKSLRGEKNSLNRMTALQTQANNDFTTSKHWSALLTSTFSGGRHVIRALVLLAGGWALWQGQLTLGTLFAFASYLESLSKPVFEISAYLSKTAKAQASLERLQELEKSFAGNEEFGGEAASIARTQDEVLEFQHVGFAYDETTPLFDGLNLSFRRGELIAMVGPSGAGKSTLIRLFNRLADPQSGEIVWEGRPLTSYKLSELRRRILVISQETFLLSTSVRENLCFAMEAKPSEEEIWAALSAVEAAGFVHELPFGLDSVIGEAGQGLSGGQMKRLSLARAFLRLNEADILVFDEPTSGLDPLSAQRVMTRIAALAAEKSLVIFSTHRPVEIQLADRVLMVSKVAAPQLLTAQEIEDNEGFRRLARETQENLR